MYCVRKQLLISDIVSDDADTDADVVKLCIHQRMKSCCDFVFTVGIKYNSVFAEKCYFNSLYLRN